MALSTHHFHQHVYRFVEKHNCLMRILNANVELDDAFPAAQSFFNVRYLQKLYGIEASDDVLEPRCVYEWLQTETTWIISPQIEVTPPPRQPNTSSLTHSQFRFFHNMFGFVSIGDYPNHCRFERRTSDTERLLEIGLLGGKGGTGRVLLALVLIQAELEQYDGVCLELLAGKLNRRAFKLYSQFGFQHERVFDDNDKPVKNLHGHVMFYMTKRRTPTQPTLIDETLLHSQLNLDRNNPPPLTTEISIVNDDDTKVDDYYENDNNNVDDLVAQFEKTTCLDDSNSDDNYNYDDDDDDDYDNVDDDDEYFDDDVNDPDFVL